MSSPQRSVAGLLYTTGILDEVLMGHWKEGAARVRYLVVLGLVRAEATWDLGDVWLVVMRCSSGSQTMLGQLEWARGTCPGRTQPAGGPSRGEEPLSGPLTNRPVATVLGIDLMTPRPGLLHEGTGSLGPGHLPGQRCWRATVDGFLLLHSCYQTEGVHLKESICLLTSKPNNVQKEFTAKKVGLF